METLRDLKSKSNQDTTVTLKMFELLYIEMYLVSRVIPESFAKPKTKGKKSENLNKEQAEAAKKLKDEKNKEIEKLREKHEKELRAEKSEKVFSESYQIQVHFQLLDL